MIHVIASFTADPILPFLRWLTQQAGIDRPVSLTAYGQVFQTLLDPNSEPARTKDAVVVVLLRMEDLVRDRAEEERGTAVSGIAEELASALRSFGERARGPVLVALLPSAESDSYQEAERRFLDAIDGIGRLRNIACESVRAVVDLDAEHDAQADELGHVPYTEAGFAGLALSVTRALHSAIVPAHKVLVLDCDNTLWGGVVGEDGADGLALTPPFLALQAFAVRAQERGILVCLASKNVESDVQEVFERRADMVLQPEHVVAKRINWLPKPQNVSALAAELNLGLDSFVFIDDNPVEVGQMREALPQVVTLQLPSPDAVASFLANLWVFDKQTVTQEDRRRTQMYRENQERQQLEAVATDIGAFIASLQLEVDIAEPGEDEWARVSQLTHRTNQFNFTTRRRSEAEMRDLASAPGQTVTRVKVRDRFGDYGLVGVMAYTATADAIEMDSFMLSCRVLGRGVEHAMVKHLADAACRAGKAFVALPFLATPKNEPARAFAESIAAPWRQDGLPGEVLYRIPAAAAQQIRHRPGEDPDEVMAAARSGDKPAKPEATAAQPLADRSLRYERLATELADGPAVLRAWREAHARVRDLPSAPQPADSADERRMLLIWERVLNIAGLGVEDDFTALGGTSLMAARLFAEIDREFGVRMRLTAILEAPTARRLAARLAQHGTGHARDNLIPLRSGRRATLFLVHDGDGETLLYRNLAERLPAGIAVVGIEPASRPGIPMAHASIEAMAAHYIAQIRARQPDGPYYLGGMCAGGVIAYEMAQQLVASGETVGLVAMLDAATPQATIRAQRLSEIRAQRFRHMREDLERRHGRSPLKYVELGWRFGVKAFNVAKWRLGDRLQAISARRRLDTLARCIRTGAPWPAHVRPLTVREIYNCAEAAYLPSPARSQRSLLLVRAMTGTGNDVPYREMYADPLLGWERVAPDIEAVDVMGGHASMLQSPWVDELASVVSFRLPGASAHPDREIARPRHPTTPRATEDRASAAA